MISGEAIIQASATILVGLVFLVTLRKSLGLRLDSAFLSYIYWPMVCLMLSIICVFFGEDVFFAGVCAFGGTPPCPAPAGVWLFGFAGRILFLAGVLLLPLVVRKIQEEARKKEDEQSAAFKRELEELRNRGYSPAVG